MTYLDYVDLIKVKAIHLYPNYQEKLANFIDKLRNEENI